MVLYGGEPPKAVKHDGSPGKPAQVYSVYMGYQWRGKRASSAPYELGIRN